MADYYYFATNEDEQNRHEVHRRSCPNFPEVSYRVNIGYHGACSEAIRAAKLEYPMEEFVRCNICCLEDHKS